MNSENSSEKLQETTNELNKKLIILKNALLEERKKTNKLEEEVNNLNNKISEKDGIILNYKNENESLNNKINKLNQNEENSENEINKETLQKENQQLQNDLTIIKDQNGVYKLKLEILTSEIEKIKKESNNEIEKLKKDLENEKTLNKINIEKQNGIENMSKKFEYNSAAIRRKESIAKDFFNNLNKYINNPKYKPSVIFNSAKIEDIEVRNAFDNYILKEWPKLVLTSPVDKSIKKNMELYLKKFYEEFLNNPTKYLNSPFLKNIVVGVPLTLAIVTNSFLSSTS